MQKWMDGGMLCILLFLSVFFAGCSSNAVPGQVTAVQAGQTPVPAQPVPFRVNDAHCHIVDFTQNSDGLPALLTKMDEAGVDHTVIYGLPVIKKYNSYDPVRPGYYNDNDGRAYYYSLTDAIVAQQYLNLSPDDRKRFYPLISGFDPTDKNAIEHISRVMALYPGVFLGIGEVLFRHDDLSRMTVDELPRANHPAMDPVYEYAAQHDMPVWIHSNIGTAGFPDPVYESEVEDVLNRHPDTRIVWGHAGYSRNLNITAHPDRVRAMLRNHPNLWVDISWVVYDDVIAKDKKLNAQWVTLIEDYPDRFMIGTDKIGNFSTYTPNIRKYDLLFNKLNPRTRDSVAYWNLYEVLPKSVPRPVREDMQVQQPVFPNAGSAQSASVNGIPAISR